MEYNVTDIQRDVRIALNENDASDKLAEFGDVDTLSLDELIKSKIVDAVRAVELQAPLSLLDRGEPFAKKIWWEDEVGVGKGYIQLPDDFMRLVTFQMSDWSHAVTTAITEESPLYARQGSRYGGIRGNPQNPVVAVIHHPTGLVLEFWSCMAGEGVSVHKARYIPIPRITSDDRIDISEKLVQSVVYYAAYLTAQSLGDGDSAGRMLTISKEYMK